MGYRNNKNSMALMIFVACIIIQNLPGSGLPVVLAANNADRVLILQSYHQGFEWTDQIMDGIESVFNNSGIEAELMI